VVSFKRASGTRVCILWYPALETPGYYQVFLRNATHFAPESLGEASVSTS
jgi:hypothetical protein